jgi:hypothetical protein
MRKVLLFVPCAIVLIVCTIWYPFVWLYVKIDGYGYIISLMEVYKDVLHYFGFYHED